jgi:ABC-2 type transport system permease protein
MIRLIATIKKDLIILLRDRSGLALLFLMPAVLIIIMALIQDAPFRDYQEFKISLLLVNNDKGSVGKTITDSLKNSKIFKVRVTMISEAEVQHLITDDKYKIGIVIPSNATENLDLKVKQFVSNTVSSFGATNDTTKKTAAPLATAEIKIYFSGDIKKSLKSSMLSSIKEFSSKMEMETLLGYFKKELNSKSGGDDGKPGEFITIKEQSSAGSPNLNYQLNSVQHNVPAWTIFGMFFIVMSLAGSMIKERNDGSYLRLLTMPGSYFVIMTGKIAAYLLVCLLQCVLMLSIGIYLLPHLGLPQLVIGTNIPAIAAVALCSGLAATGFGILVGTVFSTHQQSSAFGAVSVVILAALGGIWVPVYVMPHAVRLMAEISPLYWGLSAFHDIFLKNGNIQSILPFLLKLLLFFAVTILAAYLFNKAKNR